ncbi:hypothetical protein HPB48_020040 [Haemaphysalis longicornis]|uniref:Uncharacterized protein n=1 Tax=Haemaphysalis longicornis TaxID=44386 RepID=A0A9J6GWS2_HAELO|nr:hypothetical protein HPB48_020040 [Haemaphysalis longicornis]
MSRGIDTWQRPLRTVRKILCTGGGIHEALGDRLLQQFQLTDLKNFMGSVEALTAFCVPAPGETDYRSVGFPSPLVRIKVVSQRTGLPLGPDDKGELWVHTPNVSPGYLGDQGELLPVADSQGWLHTGRKAVSLFIHHTLASSTTHRKGCTLHLQTLSATCPVFCLKTPAHLTRRRPALNSSLRRPQPVASSPPPLRTKQTQQAHERRQPRARLFLRISVVPRPSPAGQGRPEVSELLHSPSPGPLLRRPPVAMASWQARPRHLPLSSFFLLFFSFLESLPFPFLEFLELHRLLRRRSWSSSRSRCVSQMSLRRTPVEAAPVTFLLGFVTTRDIGYYNQDGRFFVVGRLKNIIKCHDYNVSPLELESILLSHPAVSEACVVGVPDERILEAPTAFVVRKESSGERGGVTEQELVDLVASKKPYPLFCLRCAFAYAAYLEM